jgi:hypothetical protein
MTPQPEDDSGQAHQEPGPGSVRAALRTQRAAAFAGIAFSILCALAMVCIRMVVPPLPADSGKWLLESSRRDLVLFALNLVPFAGIAFLWFIGVIRDRVGSSEDRLFATVFLGSGLMFTAMLFAAVAVAAGLIDQVGPHYANLVNSGTWGTERHIVGELMSLAMRMAGVFTIATSTILLRTRTMSKWVALAGYAIGLALLLLVGVVPWLQLLFPAWVFLLSLVILYSHFRESLEPVLGTPEVSLGQL